jgi:hypothetical protein
MTPERWAEIERIYHAALERDATVRAAFLAEACKGDDALQREVESLLAQAPGAIRLGIAVIVLPAGRVPQ